MNEPAVIDAPDASLPDDGGSLADHEASFARPGGRPMAPAVETRPTADSEGIDDDTQTAEERERDEQGRFRHRAASQKAKPEDVSTINALTKELRTKEQELAKIDPDGEKDNPRVRALKRQIAAVDAALSAKKPQTSSAPAPKPIESAPPRPPVAAPAKTFDTPKPTIQSLTAAGVEDPYAALPEAIGEWYEQKRAFEDQQRTHSEQVKAWEAKQREVVETHKASIAAFKQTHPDWDQVMSASTVANISPVMNAALLHSDAQFVYHLAKQPEFADELFTQTAAVLPDHPHFWDLVASTQRRLKQHAQAATTGSAAVARVPPIPPKPPNPVRTGPIRTGDDLPSDESSLAEHERAFGPKRRR